jgi:hypothetical protein
MKNALCCLLQRRIRIQKPVVTYDSKLRQKGRVSRFEATLPTVFADETLKNWLIIVDIVYYVEM